MTIQQINRALRVLWEFKFRNVNKESGDAGPVQVIVVAVSAVRKGNYRKMEAMKSDAVRKFSVIVGTMYPKADQHVLDYGPVNMRVFV